MSRRLFPLVIGAVLLLAHQAAAATFRLQHDGKPVAGGKVCLFEAASVTDPLPRLTAFTSLECQPAESVALPKRGQWNLFAIHEAGFVTPSLLLVTNGQVESSLRALDVVPAVEIRVESLPEGARFAVYLESTGAVIPAGDGERVLHAPKGFTLFPLLLSDGAVRQIGSAVTAEEFAEVRWSESTAELRDVAVGLGPDAAAFAKIPAKSRTAGRVVLRHGSSTRTPENRIDPVFRGMPALALFRRVALQSESKVAVAGEGWAAEEVKLTNGATLRIAPATTLRVDWSFGANIGELARHQQRACPELDEDRDAVSGTDAEAVTLSLFRCSGLQRGQNAANVKLSDCSSVADELLGTERLSGSNRFEGIAPGFYLLRLAWLHLPPALQIIEVERPDDSALIDLSLAAVYGTVTRGGEPFFGWIGIGPGAVSDEQTGAFVALVKPRPAGSPRFPHVSHVPLRSCTDSFSYLHTPDEDPEPNTRFDIEIPENTIRVSVSDVATGRPLEGVAVTLAANLPGQKEAAHYTRSLGNTDAGGSVAAESVSTNREIRICATHEQYHKGCADAFTIGSRRSVDVPLRLAPAETRSGRVIADGPISRGGLQWYSPAGARLESIPVQPDGSFTSKLPHAAGEVLVFISASHPLLITRMPAVGEGDTLQLALPAVRARSVDVVVSEGVAERVGWATFKVGGMVVPNGAMMQHLLAQGQPHVLNPGPARFGPVYETGPIELIFGPASYFHARLRSAIDPFYMPEAASLPRTPLREETRIEVGR
ncbi:MAG TPA: hypothetical protein VF701_18970 [Thermoanaerobaculia bacterium]